MELFKAQNYAKIRKDHLDMGLPWTDPSFPPSDTSIGHSKSSKLPPVVKWMRPSVSKNKITVTNKLFSSFQCIK